jgi:hypothetical protein
MIMHRKTCTSALATLLFILLQFSSPTYAQVALEDPDIGMPRLKCFTLNEAGLSVGFGLLAELGISTGTMAAPHFLEDVENPIPYGGALSLNLYSPNSILNFSLRTILAFGDQNFKLEDEVAQLSYTRLEVPLLARLNFKKDVTSTTSFLVQGGPSYVRYFNSTTSLGEETVPLLDQHINLTGGIGLEFQYEKTEEGRLIPRMAMELNYSHPLKSNISPEFATLSDALTNERFNTSRLGYLNLSVHVYTR